MSFWDDVYGAVVELVNMAADAAEGGVNEVGDVAADLLETSGNGAQDAANAVGDFLGGVPAVGWLLEGTFGWLGGIVAGVTNLAGAAIKGAVGIVAGLLAGLVRLLGGIFLINGGLIIQGLQDIFSPILGAIVLLLGELVSLAQRILFLQGKDRALTEKERKFLKQAFRGSVALYNVRVIEGWAGLFSVNNRPFTLGNTIYMKGVDPSASPGTLVHECVHVWQYQNTGPRYTTDAVGAQWFYGGGSGAYDWTAELQRGVTRWWKMNRESQGSFIEDVWNQGALQIPNQILGPGNGAFFRLEEFRFGLGVGSVSGHFTAARDGTDHTEFAIASIADMRARVNLRLSHLFPVGG